MTRPSDALSRLRPHPRLMLRPDRLDELKKRMGSDPVLARYAKETCARADGYLKAPPLEHKLIGPRLLSVSREAVNRVYHLGLAWRLTGRAAYADAARDVLLTVCRFADWNPSHFLDTAEMSHAVGVGYDWLHERLSPAERDEIRAALVKLGLEPGLKVYRGGGWWAGSEFNWNQVCNGGLLAGALAIAEDEPAAAGEILNAAVASLPKALKTYEPDGAWGEGPSYWVYATDYTAYGLAAMESALGTDFGLSDRKGLAAAGDFPLCLTGPTGLYAGFADVGERSGPRSLPVLYWLARRYDRPELAAAQARLLERAKASALDFIWYAPSAAAPARRLDRLFRGPVEVAVFRSGWDEPAALFASIKAGYNSVNHGHLDLGQFELDALGQRWARDLGSDDYNLPDYWEGREGGRRWTYYRLGSFSHNLVLLDGRQQLVAGRARVEGFSDGPSPHAVVAIDGAYGPAARGARRGLMLVGHRRAVLVQDELDLAGPHDLAWGMTTDAAVTVAGPMAKLKLAGKELEARILAPAGAEFSVESAQRQPPEKANAGVSRLMVRLTKCQGPVRLAVLLSPVWPEGAVRSAEIVPLNQWPKSS